MMSKSLDRFPIYARLGVPEIWCYDDGSLNIYHLHGDEYVKADVSLALSQLPVQELPRLIETHRAEGRRALRRSVREWARKWK